jgi:hypothetical protein
LIQRRTAAGSQRRADPVRELSLLGGLDLGPTIATLQGTVTCSCCGDVPLDFDFTPAAP